ncbi:hypothetical protein QPK32_07280 [Massilia sp. YIM B02763]|uniref:hypothetical protein n=1 Tax=Massilia sp. YIM B02763 TaxID=3050130 RepID=UPI0025B6E7B1|nr:hypothetical protein [Massilia sp. YIM B02763]MDN4052874.1 hypothetical protein [Massilia sp. YIM B02763]
MNAKNQAAAQKAPSSADGIDANLYLAGLNDIRRTRLSLLISERAGGNVSKFAQSLGYSHSQLHQFLSPTYNEGRSIGELAARLLEQRAGLQFGWLDQRLNEDAGKTSGITEHDQRQLAEQRDATDAAVRSNFVRTTGDGLTVPAAAGAASLVDPAKAGTPELCPGEVYAGVAIWPNGDPYHLILSPDDKRINGIYEAERILRGMGKEHDLPTYIELTILCKRLPQQFHPSLYHTGDEEVHEGGTMPVLFDTTPAGQRRRDENELRLRAIRRVPANEEAVDFAAITAEQREITIDAARSVAGSGADCASPAVECFITSAEVAAVAVRLIDEAARNDDGGEQPTADDHLVRAGIMTGICSMAMEIQSLLASKRKAVGHE